MKLSIASILALTSALLLIGCGSPAVPRDASPGTQTESTHPKKKLRIVLIAKSSTNPVFLAARVGAEAAARDLSAKGEAEVTIDWRTPEVEDGQVQANRIAQAVSEGADAILISCSDAAKVTGAIDDAVAAGVPVMTFDSDAPDSKRFAFYGGDSKDIGKQVMLELSKQLKGRGQVAVLAGNPNAPNLQLRVAGALEEAKRHPGVQVIGTFYHPETPQDAAAEVLRAMQANPEIDGWAMIGGWPLFTKALLTDLDPNKVKVVAVDCLPAQMAYIDKGIAPVLLAQPTYDWGYVSVQKIYEYVIDEAEIPQVVKMELVPVRKENLKDWAKKLVDWGFSDVDPKFLE